MVSKTARCRLLLLLPAKVAALLQVAVAYSERSRKSRLISAAAEASPHSAPLTSIPPPAPPEQNASDPAAVFTAFADTLGGAAACSFLLAGTAIAVGVVSLPDVGIKRLAEAFAEASALPSWMTCAGRLVAGPVMRAAISLGQLHSLPVASIPPPLPPEHIWACTGPTITAASDNENIRSRFI